DAVAGGPLRQRGEQLPADAAALGLGAHAERLEPQVAAAAAELAFGDARLDVSEQSLVVAGGELRVRAGLAQRRRKPALEIRAARSALDCAVDGHDGVEVATRERADDDG